MKLRNLAHLPTSKPSSKRFLLGIGFLLFALFALALFLWQITPSASQPQNILDSKASNYYWTYSSKADYRTSGDVQNHLNCSAKGMLSSKASEFALHIEQFACNEQNLVQSESYTFSKNDILHADPKSLDQASPINALARALLREMDLGRSLPPKLNRWTYEEMRSQGILKRTIEILARTPKLLWTNHSRSDVSTRPDVQDVLETESKGEGDANSNGLIGIQSVQTREREDVTVGGKPLSTVEVTIDMNRSELPIPTVKTYKTLPLAMQKPDRIHEGEEILKEWRLLKGDPHTSKSASDPLYVRLKMALRQDPELASEFRHQLESLELNSEPFKLLLGALAYAGTDEATQVLVESARAKAKDSAWQAAFVPVLGLSHYPNAESWDYLDKVRQQSIEPDNRKAAELAMASELRTGVPEESSKDFLNEIRERPTPDSNAIKGVLDIIGNAALESELNRAETWAKNPDATVRATVAESLRSMESVASEQLLLQLLKDPDMEVRRVSAHAFESRSISAQALPVLVNSLGESTDELQQVSLLETLYKSRPLDTSVIAQLKSKAAGMVMSEAVRERWQTLEQALGTQVK